MSSNAGSTCSRPHRKCSPQNYGAYGDLMNSQASVSSVSCIDSQHTPSSTSYADIMASRSAVNKYTTRQPSAGRKSLLNSSIQANSQLTSIMQPPEKPIIVVKIPSLPSTIDQSPASIVDEASSLSSSQISSLELPSPIVSHDSAFQPDNSHKEELDIVSPEETREKTKKCGYWKNIRGGLEKLERLNQPSKLESRWAC